MQREIIADIEPPATADPKIAVMNLVQVPLYYRINTLRHSYVDEFDSPSLNHGFPREYTLGMWRV